MTAALVIALDVACRVVVVVCEATAVAASWVWALRSRSARAASQSIAARLASWLDYHVHRCDDCGVLWGHRGAFSAGDCDSPVAVGRHACPRCGRAQWSRW